jgi:TonB-dependent receptor
MYSKTIKLFLFLLVLFFSANVFAGVIKGKVIDAKTGEPLVGAIVEIENGAVKHKAIVNLDGSFVFKNIPAGDYELKITSSGYKTNEETNVTVKSNEDIEILQDIVLNENIKELESVNIISGGNGTTDRGVRNIEKNSDYVQNILSQRAIELSPDLTAANALQRVSGITIQRSNDGEGRYAIIRGMDQRYNTTLINGIKIPSPDDQYRYVPMDLFPSELLERIEVIKTLTPNMEGDAIGGVMNLVMKNAPDKFLLTANVSAGYSFLFSGRPFSAFNNSGMNKYSPDQLHGSNYMATAADFNLSNLAYTNKSLPLNNTIGLTIGDRFLNNKLGVIISAAYQNFYKGSNSDLYVLSSQGTPEPYQDLPQFTDIDVRKYSTQTNRIAFNNKIDYAFNKRNKISLFNFYVRQNDFQTRLTQDTTLGTNSAVNTKLVDLEFRSKWQIQNIYNATLQGQHQLTDKLKFDWSGVYSIAKNQIPDLSTYDYNDQVTIDPSTGNVINNKNEFNGTNGVSHTWQYNTDQDWAGYGNITYVPRILGENVEFEGGGLYRYKTRTNYYAQYGLVSSSLSAIVPFTNIDSIPLVFNPPT